MADHYTPGAASTPLPPSPSFVGENAPFLDPPRASYLESSPVTPRDSYAPSTHVSNNNSGPLLPPAGKNETDEYLDEQARSPSRKKRRPALLILIGLTILVVIVLAVILPIYFTVIKPKQRNHSGSSGSNTDPAGTGPKGEGKGDPESPTGATSGSDGSTIIGEDGTTFTYNNKFGGFCKFQIFFRRLVFGIDIEHEKNHKTSSLLVTWCNNG